MPQSTFHSKFVPVPASGTFSVPAGEPVCHAEVGAIASVPGAANGPGSDRPHELTAKTPAHDADACAGTARKAKASTNATMRIRGFTPRVIGRCRQT